MIEEQATVVAIEHHNVTVTSDIKSACSGCQQVDNCGSGQVAKAFPQKKLTMNLVSTMPLQLGDKVIVGMNESALLSSALQVYLWPLFGLIAAAWCGQYLISINYLNHEVFAIVFAIVGGVIGFMLAKRQQKKSINYNKLTPEILRMDEQNINVVNLD